MPESGLSGSVRGVPSNGHPYRDPGPLPELTDAGGDCPVTGEHPSPPHVPARRLFLTRLRHSPA